MDTRFSTSRPANCAQLRINSRARGALTPPVLSHDGTRLLACGRDKDAPGSDLALKMIDLETGALTGSDDTAPQGIFNGEGCGDGVFPSLTALARCETNGLFMVTAYEDGHIGVYCVDVSGESLKWERVTPPGGSFGCIAAPRDGALPCLYTDATHPAEVCLFEPATGDLTAIAHHNAWLDGALLSGMRAFKALALDGKACLAGWVMLPEGADGAPVLLWPHGGPAGFYADAFSLERQAAAARGYAVVLPNPRGSTGYGFAYEDAERAYDGGAGIDCLTLLDAALTEFPALDPMRVGVIGGSYGGYMAAWMAGNTRRFKAAVVLKAVTNWLFIHFKSSQGGQPVFDEYRDFQDFLVDTVRKSPIYRAGDVSIPTLVIHGERDQVCPVENAHQFYVAVRDTHPDLPAKLIVMPNCCHAYGRDDVRDYAYIQEQSLAWLDQYV